MYAINGPEFGRRASIAAVSKYHSLAQIVLGGEPSASYLLPATSGGVLCLCVVQEFSDLNNSLISASKHPPNCGTIDTCQGCLGNDQALTCMATV